MRANPLEIAWTLIALAGTIYSVRLLIEYVRFRDAVPSMRRNGIRKRLAKMWTAANVVEELMTLAKQVIYVAIGIVAMLTRPPRHADHLTLYAYVLSIGLIAAALLSVARSRYRWVKWQEWRAVVLAEHAAEEGMKGQRHGEASA